MTKKEWLKLVRERWQDWAEPPEDWPPVAQEEWRRFTKAWAMEQLKDDK